ncbi:hypothetical protein [Bifidobacterium simiiventris]|uniref:hypothetical protein n=1 Tax=Bifidobacterium simiiventris TaxID=2834434 RepID=UPI001C592863|nr:hypothetical protein [Bifidobacterium simiiventris]MBW3078224.1 hypothetical protein [Bifidobacterium simiiventris]
MKTSKTFEDVMNIPANQRGDTLTARLNRAKTTNNLAAESVIIDLEARCRIADALDRIAATLGQLANVPPESTQG